jgi:hypothetical protein
MRSLREIADALAAQGHTAKGGAPLAASVVMWMLKVSWPAVERGIAAVSAGGQRHVSHQLVYRCLSARTFPSSHFACRRNTRFVSQLVTFGRPIGDPCAHASGCARSLSANSMPLDQARPDSGPPTRSTPNKRISRGVGICGVPPRWSAPSP